MRKSMTAGIFGGFAFALIAGAVMVPANQDTLKLGFIDSQTVIGAYPGTQEAQATFNTENAAWEREATAMQNEVQRLNQELERQSMAMTQERRTQLTAELQQKYAEYQEFIDRIWGQNGEAYQRNQELMAPIIERVNTLLEQVGQDEDYDYIFDAASGGLVYAAPAYDLTPRIIELMGTGEEEPDRPQAR
jgi:outer membrane protein